MSSHPSQIRIAALNAASQAADEHEDAFKSAKPSQTKEAQVSQILKAKTLIMMFMIPILTVVSQCFYSLSVLQEAEAFALYHKALDLQKHDKFDESAKAYHELLKTPLLKEVIIPVAVCFMC